MYEYLKRKIDIYLDEWKNDPNHKPLIVKGARQVGKTSSILNFARNNYENVIEINFVSHPEYKKIIDDGYGPEEICKKISRINPKAKFIEGKTLIFFDEVQDFPDIMTSLKFFAIDGKYDVICSGSLLGIHYKDITSISVGYKTDVEMRSLDFQEFLWALGYEDSVIREMLSHMKSATPFSQLEMDIYNEKFLDYCLVGGMPDVVRDFVKNNNYSNTLQLQRQIILGYEQDIRKYAMGIDKARISNVFRSIPYQLGKENKKFQISKVGKGARFSDYRGSVEWLEDSGIVNISRALQTPSLPIKGNVIEDCCVIYFGDSGLLLSQLEDEAQMDFRRDDNFDIYKGGFFESVIAEALVKSGYELHYYKKDDSTLQEEFFVRCKNYLVPIEVKAGRNQSKSLSTLIKSSNYKEIKFGIKICKGNIGFENNILTIPHFCAFLIKDFLSDFDYDKQVENGRIKAVQ